MIDGEETVESDDMEADSLYSKSKERTNRDDLDDMSLDNNASELGTRYLNTMNLQNSNSSSRSWLCTFPASTTTRLTKTWLLRW